MNYIINHRKQDLKNNYKFHQKFKEVIKKQFNEFKQNELENKFLKDAQENIDIKLMEMKQIFQDLKMEFNEVTEILKKTQTYIKMEF